jgi:hypothetical protein
MTKTTLGCCGGPAFSFEHFFPGLLGDFVFEFFGRVIQQIARRQTHADGTIVIFITIIIMIIVIICGGGGGVVVVVSIHDDSGCLIFLKKTDTRDASL